MPTAESASARTPNPAESAANRRSRCVASRRLCEIEKNLTPIIGPAWLTTRNTDVLSTGGRSVE